MTLKERFLNIKMPHTYILLFSVLLLVTLMAYIVPAGAYDRIEDVNTGRMIVIPDSFHEVEVDKPSFFDVFLALQKGAVEASDIIFLILFAYGFVYILIKNGTFDASLGALMNKIGDKVDFLIPICMLIFGILSATIGLYEEFYGIVPIFIGIAIALGYDPIVGGAIVFTGIGTGFAAAIMNPFSIGIAQSLAGVPLFSGIKFRIVMFIVFEIVSISYVWKYAHKVKKDPTKSILYGIKLDNMIVKNSDELKKLKLNGRHKLCLLAFVFTIFMLLYGTTVWGWYINEIATLFLIMMLVVGFIGGFNATKICNTFVEGSKTMVFSIMICAFTRGISILMRESSISDSIVYYAITLLEGQSRYLSAIGMLVIQNFINFFITGSTSQATITMPIMTPIADLMGLSRQIAVLAFQMGDGFSNMFWPTVVAFECGVMGIPINKWYKFIAPLFGIFVVLQLLFMIIAVSINYS